MNVWLALVAMALGGLHALEPRPPATHSRTATHPAAFPRRADAAWHAVGLFAWCSAVLLLVKLAHLAWPTANGPRLRLCLGGVIVLLGAGTLLRRLARTEPHHAHSPRDGWRLWSRRGGGSAADQDRGWAAGLLRRGMLPSPAALAVLLAAVAVQNVRAGLLLLLAFSVGLGVTLLGSGFAGDARRSASSPGLPGWRYVGSPLLMMGLGVALGAVGLAAVHPGPWGLDLAAPGGAGLTGGNMGTVLLVSGLGLLLGMRHSTDADHVVAISTIVSKQRGILNAALIGSMWGLGHTITIFAVGALIILAGITIPPRIGLAMEFSVALMLILLGCLNLTGVTARLMRRLSPASAGTAEVTQPDAAAVVPAQDGMMRGWVSRLGMFQLVRPLVIGLVHGLAGSAAVALMVLSTIHNPVWATMYLLIFGFGTVLGMMVMTSALAVPLTYAGNRSTQLSRYFGITSGLISVCFGLFLVYQLGYVGGLFTSHPQWTPQ